ncbi:MAG TPA: MFS transporter [Steroidobacteraceae bacterium]|jgi:SHS family lactate transporter-like MFS transporter|nr:MFS transporter [Steroidobacteraceae bacterium]
MADREVWTSTQRHVVTASFMGWMLDAFDFFLVVFVINQLSSEFHAPVKDVSEALFLTLAMRPVGAFLFGRIADHFGRKPALMIAVVFYSVAELATAASPSLTAFLVLRALFGIGMGGVWGVGASLAFEAVPTSSRGFVSGLLQVGYPTGYLLASVVYGLLFDHIGWRGMFILGAAPALLVFYIHRAVPESSVWTEMRNQPKASGLLHSLKGHWGLALYAMILMACFNFFSHGTQDLYPTFLQKQHGFDTHMTSRIAITYNIGAIIGGLLFGTLSSRMGRRKTIALASALALVAIPFWAYGTTAVGLAIGAFFMQVLVQGAWGVVPAHLNELAPAGIRATFPGVVYQLGNLIASRNSVIQATLAEQHGSVAHPDYSYALALIAGVAAVLLVVLALIGPEKRDVHFGNPSPPP